MTASDRTSIPLHFRLRDAEAARLKALVARFGVPKAFIARRCLDLGMKVLESNPAEFASADAQDEDEEDDA